MRSDLLSLVRPRLGYGFHAEFLDEEQTLLLSENNQVLLSGRLYGLVLSRVGEGIALDELVRGLEGEASGPEIMYAVNLLARHGYISESNPSLPDEVCAYWHSMGLDGGILAKVLAEKPVSLETIGEIKPDVFLEVFRANGIRLASAGALTVILTREYDRQDIQRLNDAAMASKSPWMLINPSGVETWIGPLFVPGKTGCWECLAQRLRNNRQVNRFYRAVKQTRENPPLPPAASPMSLAVTANLAATEIIKWLYYGENRKLEGQVIRLDTASLALDSHVLVKRPQCRACGTPLPKDREPGPVWIRRKSAYCINRLGGYREKTPEDTIAEYRHHVSPITGVARHLEPIAGDAGAPVYNYTSGHNIALNSSSLKWLNQHLRRFNIGKGRNRSQAKAGALCESIERYSCTWQGDEPRITASLRELGDTGIHPNTCMNFSESQYRDRDSMNQECQSFHHMVPVPFDETAALEWTPVWSLTENRFKYLPAGFCYAQYPAGDDSRQFCYPDTNGSAAGNSIEEAMLQGFLELVERDAVAIWWYNRIQRPQVDLGSFKDPYFNELSAYYASLNRGLHVLDISTDLGIPSFAAVSHRLDATGPRDIIFAFGAHVEAAIGIERALLEVNQILHVVHGPEADRSAGKYQTQDPHFLKWLSEATMENQPYLCPAQDKGPKRAGDYPRLCDPTVYGGVTHCIDAMAAHDLEPLVLDMTRPDIGLPVVKVMVPGLRHFWKRLGPGRLYEVPVRMGWLEECPQESDLNQVGVFI